jgi:hypothetical protein
MLLQDSPGWTEENHRNLQTRSRITITSVQAEVMKLPESNSQLFGIGGIRGKYYGEVCLSLLPKFTGFLFITAEGHTCFVLRSVGVRET